MADLTDFQKTDLVDDHLAADYNRLLGAVLRAEFVNTETITGTKELADSDCQMQVITPSGANRTVELPPEATTNHVHFIKCAAGSSYDVVVKDDSGAATYCTLDAGESVLCIPAGSAWHVYYSRPTPAVGQMVNGKISVTVSSDDLVLEIKTLADADPSASDPVYININGTVRTVTAATSCILADGTNWFGAGGASFATKEIDYFAYAIWDSDSSVVAVAPARIPFGRVVSDFSATTTNEKHLGNYANYTATDDVCVIGRFAATLSAGAGYTWTVPTFTGVNLIQSPTFETRLLTMTVSTAAGNLTAGTGSPTTVTDTATYKVVGRQLFIKHIILVTDKGTADGYMRVPFPIALSASECFYGVENVAVGYTCYATSPSTTVASLRKYDLTTLWQTGHGFVFSGWMYIP